MASQVMMLVLLFPLFSSVICGEMTVTHSPNSLRFGSAAVMRATDLDDLLAVSLGYTPLQSSPWRGLTITTPFSPPSSAMVVEVRGGGASVLLEGASYGLKEDTSMTEVFHRLKNMYGARAQRHTLFKYFSLYGMLEDDQTHYTLPEATLLNSTKEPDSTFLHEMAAMIKTAHNLETMTTTQHGGQDVFFLELDSLEQLVEVYGAESPQVIEAIDILRIHLVKLTDMMRRLYNDQVLVVVAIQDEPHTHSRKTRSILQTPPTETDHNINFEYSEDFPAMFNIILWLSIVLALTTLAISVSMATMDPGRDSIIYRMTTMRMKKEN